jgi:hypothetical protein
MTPNDDKNMHDPVGGFDAFDGMGPTRNVYTVSQLNAAIKLLLEERFPFVWIVAEISNLRVPVSGHFYFTLKDEAAQINAVMFRGQQRQLKFVPSPERLRAPGHLPDHSGIHGTGWHRCAANRL